MSEQGIPLAFHGSFPTCHSRSPHFSVSRCSLQNREHLASWPSLTSVTDCQQFLQRQILRAIILSTFIQPLTTMILCELNHKMHCNHFQFIVLSYFFPKRLTIHFFSIRISNQLRPSYTEKLHSTIIHDHLTT